MKLVSFSTDMHVAQLLEIMITSLRPIWSIGEQHKVWIFFSLEDLRVFLLSNGELDLLNHSKGYKKTLFSGKLITGSLLQGAAGQYFYKMMYFCP